MPNSTGWSSTSEPCRLEWRPSRWATGALIGLALLAPWCVLQSEMPRAAAWPLAVLASAWGLWSAWRERGRPSHWFELAPGSGAATLDAKPLALATIRWRGPLAFLYWQDEGGQGERLVWWPDTLTAPERRAVKIAASAAPALGGMAP